MAYTCMQRQRYIFIMRAMYVQSYIYIYVFGGLLLWLLSETLQMVGVRALMRRSCIGMVLDFAVEVLRCSFSVFADKKKWRLAGDGLYMTGTGNIPTTACYPNAFQPLHATSDHSIVRTLELTHMLILAHIYIYTRI